jgi:hypothetical protein
MKNRSVKQWVPAPATDAQRTPNALLGAYLNPGEQVQWAYTITPEGKRIVTGYDIIPPKASKRRKSLSDE